MIRTNFTRVFSLDLRSLALFRFGMGFFIIVDLLRRARDLMAHYTDDGVVSREVLLNLKWEKGYHSLYMISGDTTFVVAMFILAAIFAIMLMVGYRTRLATFVSWILMASIQTRNPMVLSSADGIFRLALFWSIFLPLGARYSVDFALGPNQDDKTPNNFFNIAAVPFVLQLLIMYIFTAFLKDGDIWRKDYTALYYAFSLDSFTTFIGRWFLNFPGLLKFLSWFTIFFEIWITLFYLFPIKNHWARYFSISIFIGFHATLIVGMNIGLFPWVCIVYWLAFLPSHFWDNLNSRFGDKYSIKPIYDRVIEFARKYCKVTKPINYNLPKVVKAFVVYCTVLILIWNVRTVNFKYWEKIFPRSYNHLVFSLRLSQYWSMFAPYPSLSDGWFVFPGKLKNGKEVNAFRIGEKHTFKRPDNIFDTYVHQRWRKFLKNISKDKDKAFRLYFGKYICRMWNRKHKGDEQLNSFKFIYMRRKTPAPGAPDNDYKKIQLWSHGCFKKG